MRRIVFLFLLAGPLFPQKGMEKGLELLFKGKHREALGILKKSIEELRKKGNSPPPELLFDMALSALKSRDFQTAKTGFLEAKGSSSRKASMLRTMAGLGLGAAYYRLGEEEEKKGPQGLGKAMEYYKNAKEAWIRTILDGYESDAIRRNIERVNLKLERLKQQKKKQEKKDRNKKDQKKKNNNKQQKKKRKNKKNKPGSKPSSRKKPSTRPASRKNKRKPQKPRKRKLSKEEIRQLLEKLKKMEKMRLKFELLKAKQLNKGRRDW